MYSRVEIPSSDVVAEWYRTAQQASPAFQKFFEADSGSTHFLNDTLSIAHIEDVSQFTLTRFDEEQSPLRELTFRIPRSQRSLDMWNRLGTSYVCPYDVVAKIGVSLEVVIQDVKEAHSGLREMITSPIR